MIKYTFISLGIFVLIFFSSNNNKEILFSDTLNYQNTDTIRCLRIYVNKDFSYQPFGQLSFTEGELNSIFKNTYREKCESGIGDEITSYSYSFYTDGGMNKYTFVKLYQKDAFISVDVKITSNNTPLYIKKRGKKIGINYTKERVEEILNIKNINICDTLRITDEEGSNNHLLYFENNLLKKIVLHQTVN